MDTGIDKNHPDLRDNFIGGLAAIAGDTALPGTRNDNSGGGHGTGCAGFVCAKRGNNIGISGIAPDVSLYDVRVFRASVSGPGITYAEFMAAYTWCGVNAIDVVNMSFGTANPGSTPRYDKKDEWNQAMKDEETALVNATLLGTTFVAATGNEGDGGNRKNKYADRTYPAGYPITVSVGAIMPDDSLASFSNTGDSVALVGPGESNRRDPPYGLTTMSGRNPVDNNKLVRDGYSWFAGTSMAAPHVTGCVALALGSFVHSKRCKKAYNTYPEKIKLRSNVVMRLIGMTADKLDGSGWPTGDQRFGFGVPQIDKVVRALLDVNGEGDSLDLDFGRTGDGIPAIAGVPNYPTVKPLFA